MAMNCLKYFISDVLFVLMTFAFHRLAHTKTNSQTTAIFKPRYKIEYVCWYAIYYYLIRQRMAAKGKCKHYGLK